MVNFKLWSANKAPKSTSIKQNYSSQSHSEDLTPEDPKPIDDDLEQARAGQKSKIEISSDTHVPEMNSPSKIKAPEAPTNPQSEEHPPESKQAEPRLETQKGPGPTTVGETLPAGKVTEEGNIVDYDGKVIGRVSDDDEAKLKELIGQTVDEEGDIIDNDGNVLGTAVPNPEETTEDSKPVKSEHAEPSAEDPISAEAGLEVARTTTQPETHNKDAEDTKSGEEQKNPAVESASTSATDKEAHTDETEVHSATSGTQEAREEPHTQAPVLSEDDEQFLQRITSQMEHAPSLSRRATMIADNGDMTEDAEVEEASTVPLPTSPQGEKDKQLGDEVAKPQTWMDRWNQLSFVPTAPSGLPFISPEVLSTYKQRWSSKDKDKDRQLTADSLQSAIDASKGGTEEPAEKVDVEQSNRDVSSVLKNLNLSSINNRVVGISNDTQALLESFNTVLKDIINGGPTAYEDLEKLLSERESQLDRLFGTLPPFLQTLVKNIPVKMYSALAPSLAAAMTTKKGEGSISTAETLEVEEAQPEKSGDKKTKKSIIPSLRSLVTEQGAVAAMLKSIVNFLEMRFPALLSGTNMIMSLAVFVLLFVFWYCHKRGRETRLSKERVPEALPADESLTELEEKADLENGASLAAQDETEKPDVPLPETGDQMEGTKSEQPAEKISEADQKVNDLQEKSGLERETLVPVQDENKPVTTSSTDEHGQKTS